LSRFPTPHDSDPLASLNPSVTTRSLQRPSGCAGSWSPSSGACRRCVVLSFFCTISPFSLSIKKTNPFSQLLSLVTAMKKRFRSHPPEKHSNPIGCTTPITFHPNLEQSFLASAKKYGINCFNLFSQSSTVPPSKHFAPPSPRWMAGG